MNIHQIIIIFSATLGSEYDNLKTAVGLSEPVENGYLLENISSLIIVHYREE